MKRFAHFIFLVTLLFACDIAVSNAADCVTYFSGRAQYRSCAALEKDCDSILQIYSNFPEVDRNVIRTTCRQFPSWKDADCDNLKLTYLTNPNFSLLDKRYIYDSCKYLPPSWGARP